MKFSAITVVAVAAVLTGCTASHAHHSADPKRTTAATTPTPTATQSASNKPGVSPTPGAEAVVADQCRITSAAAVGAAYGGRVGAESGTTTGVGNPICRFTMSRSNVGRPGMVTVSLSTAESVAVFRRSVRHQSAVHGVCESAYYANATLRFRQGHTTGAISASLRTPGSRQPAPQRLRADAIALAKSMCAQF